MQANFFSSSWMRIVTFSVLSTIGVHQAAFAKETWVLEKVVEIARHGIVPPSAEIRQSTAKSTGYRWPAWDTAEGRLTQHGEEAIVLKGFYEGNAYRKIHFMPESCPSPADVYIWTSPADITKASAKALASSLFPNCNVPVFAENSSKGSNKNSDTLFNPTRSGLIHIDKNFAQQQAMQAMDQEPQGFLAQYANQIKYLSNVVCAVKQPCPLFDQINKKESSAKQVLNAISGLSDIAESLQMTYSEGLIIDHIVPNHAVSTEDIGRLIALQPLKSIVSQNTPYIAQQDSSTLMAQIQKALSQGTNIEQKKDNIPAMNARYLLLVAHYSNISQLKTLLHFNWQLGAYPKGNIPPGSSLVFERWLNTSTQQRYLHVYFQTQSLDQIRNLQVINSDNPFLKAEWQPAESIKTPNGYMLPFNYAMSFIETQIDPSAIVPVKLPAKID